MRALNVFAAVAWMISASQWIQAATLKRPPAPTVSADEPKQYREWVEMSGKMNERAAYAAGAAGFVQMLVALIGVYVGR